MACGSIGNLEPNHAGLSVICNILTALKECQELCNHLLGRQLTIAIKGIGLFNQTLDASFRELQLRSNANEFTSTKP